MTPKEDILAIVKKVADDQPIEKKIKPTKIQAAIAAHGRHSLLDPPRWGSYVWIIFHKTVGLYCPSYHTPIVSPNVLSFAMDASHVPLSAAKAKYRHKTDKHLKAHVDANVEFVPYIMESTGRGFI